jgi:hypothetical protein
LADSKPRAQLQPEGVIFWVVVKIHDASSFGRSRLHSSPLELWSAFGGKSGDGLARIHRDV